MGEIAEAKDEMIEELKSLEKQFDAWATAADKMGETLECIDSSPYIDGYVKKFLAEEKMPKKQREKLALAHLKSKYPKIMKQLQEKMLLLEGVNLIFQQMHEKVLRLEEGIGELRDLKEELESEMNDL